MTANVVLVRCFVVVLVFGQAWSTPVLYHESDARPLAVVSDIGQRLASHSRFQESSATGSSGDSRLVLPSPQELEAIKKVAQILVTLGEQVIPTIIGEYPQRPNKCDTTPLEDIPNDPVN